MTTATQNKKVTKVTKPISITVANNHLGILGRVNASVTITKNNDSRYTFMTAKQARRMADKLNDLADYLDDVVEAKELDALENA